MAQQARVVAHRVNQGADRIGIIVAYHCPLCGDEHGAAWHSPTPEGGERTPPCEPVVGGRSVALTWPGIPGSITAALIEWRPDILTRGDAQWPTPDPTQEV